MSHLGRFTGEPAASRSVSQQPPQKVVIALPGGGIRCAWQAGALQFLLERLNVEIVAISGTSGGAFNGAIISSHLRSTDSRSESVAAQLGAAWSSMQPYALTNRVMQQLLSRQATDYVKAAMAVTSRIMGHPLVHAFSPFIGNPGHASPPLYINYTLPNGESRTRLWSGSVQEIAASAAHMDAFPAVQMPGDGACFDGIHGGPNACKSMLRPHLEPQTWLLRLDVWKDPELAVMDAEMARKKRALPEAQVAELMAAIPGLRYHRIQPAMAMPKDIFHGDNVTIAALLLGGYSDMERYFKTHAPQLIKAAPTGVFNPMAAWERAATAMLNACMSPHPWWQPRPADSTAPRPQPAQQPYPAGYHRS
jgi:hypothetical protein